jgi:hypothetical protein
MEGKGNDEAIEYLNGSQTNSASWCIRSSEKKGDISR